jgi:hypothetical protein
MQHVAILHRQYLDAILGGSKTVESRLSATKSAPFGRVQPGDMIHFKETGGQFRATAVVAGVMTFEDLRPADVRTLARRYGPQIGAEATYWESRQDARYATFITLRDVRPTDAAPAGFAVTPGARSAWYVLDRVKRASARRSA